MRSWLVAPLVALLCAAPPCASAQSPAALQSPTSPPVASDATEARDEGDTSTGVGDTSEAPTSDGSDQVSVTPVPGPVPAGVQANALRVPSVSSLFGELGGDFLNVRTADNVMVILAAGAAAGVVHPYDAALTEYFSTSPTLTTFFAPGKIVGGFAVQFGGSVATYAIGRATGQRRTAMVGADLVRAQLVTQTFTQALKLSLNRQRPDGDNWSLPSGHSSGTFASATVLHQHFGWKVGAPAYAVAAYVAASRLAEDRHYASDVILGAGIGIVSARAVTIGRGANRFALTPMTVPGGGAGVAFTRLAN